MSYVNIENLYDLPCSVYWKDTKGIYRGLNDYVAKTLNGPKAMDVVGFQDHDLLLSEVVTPIRNHDMQVQTKESALIIVEDARFNEKTKFNDYTVLSYKRPLYSQRNKVLGIMALSFVLKSDESLAEFFNYFHLPIDPVIKTKLINTQHHIASKNGRVLTERQKDCLYYLVQGKTVKQIANILNLSPRTIEHHFDAIKAKYQCTSRSELIMLALKMDFIKQKLTNFA